MSVAFTDLGATQQSGYDGASPRIELARTEGDRVVVRIYGGAQRTGGYGIKVNEVERRGPTLVVHATFSAPPKEAFVTQVLTSPAQSIGIAPSDAANVRDAILVDQSGTQRARTSVPWSAP